MTEAHSKSKPVTHATFGVLALPAVAGVTGLMALTLLLGAFTPKTEAVATTAAVAGASTSSSTPQVIKVADAATSAETASMSAAEKEKFGKFIREYLMANPEILVDVSRALEQKQREAQTVAHKETIKQRAKSIFADPIDYVYGNPKGDIAVVEYFDYNCAWCKRALNEVQQLVEQDKNVRVVMKEYPIFGEDSEFAARAALAAREQGKYWPLHVALMNQQRVTKDSVITAAKEVGLDVNKLREDMKADKVTASLKATAETAGALEIQGTPGFLVDTKVNVGYLPLANLQSLIADVRKSGGCEACN
ncbi:MAG: DsbA family protein [Pseudomonadota bacterium]